MRYVVAILFITFFGNANAQKLTGPTWDDIMPTFRTAKAEQFFSASKSYGKELYKDGTIKLENDFERQGEKVTVEVSDIFYVKDAEVKNTRYENDGEKEFITYDCFTEDKFCSITFYYYTYKPDRNYIVLSFADNYKNKNVKLTTYRLFEFKD